MSEGPWWASSPIVVVPLAMMALGLSFTPFVVWNVDHAAQFYGSLTAAAVAAGAVVGTTSMQAHFARRERREKQHEEVLADGVELYAWMSSLAADLEYQADVLGKWANDAARNFTIADLRMTVSNEVKTRLRNRLVVASRLARPFAYEVVSALHHADSILDLIAMPLLPDTYPVGREQVGKRAKRAAHSAKLVLWQKAQLGEYLVKEGAVLALPERELEALARGEPDDE